MSFENIDYDYLFKLLIIGDSGAGKSAILKRFTDHVFNDSFISTIGVDFSIRTINLDGKTIKLQIWDTAGQERFRTITASYYRGAHGIMIVFDLTNKDSFNNIKIWLSECSKYAPENVPLILVGNKADLVTKREVYEDDINNFIDQYNADNHEHPIKYIETSAKTAINIEKAFVEISKDVKHKLMKAKMEHKPKDHKIDSAAPINEGTTKCCVIM